ncbi:hypothetical protein [Virgibacillus ihumii]|uniref:hypothetical protein n=1 Tax=Virgibacillus ihumii TaxID=2686091 RepID=UPI00157C6464|nr:hypothetical protein [Virgibacillus ihumii]
MGILIIILPYISIMVGLAFITLGLWELREGVNRKKYIKYMFTGLCLIVILAPFIKFFGSAYGISFG